MSRTVAAAFVAVAWFTVSSADAEPPRPRLLTAQSGQTRAILRHVPWPNDYGRNARLRIVRAGAVRFAEMVPPHPRDPAIGDRRRIPYSTSGRPLVVRDLDGDREPEVLLNLFWGGAHCCVWLRLYRFDRAGGRYVPQNHWWGELKADYRLRDLDRDGRPELVARDDRFMGLSYYSADPIQIWWYDHGRFRDVTRRFPTQVARDAAHWWRLYLRYRPGREWVREPLAAWAADQYLLGRTRVVDRVLAAALRRGELRPRQYEPSARAWVAQLKRFLRRNHYRG